MAGEWTLSTCLLQKRNWGVLGGPIQGDGPPTRPYPNLPWGGKPVRSDTVEMGAVRLALCSRR